MEISAYSLVQAQVCAKPLSVFVTSAAGSSAPVAGSYHLISNGPGVTLCSLIVFGESGLAFTRATITTSEGPPLNQRCSLFPTPSTATLNREAAESVANMLPVMERFRKLLVAHKAAAALASGGSAQTISTAVALAASIAVKNGEVVADVPASSLQNDWFIQRLFGNPRSILAPALGIRGSQQIGIGGQPFYNVAVAADEPRRKNKCQPQACVVALYG